MTKAEKLQVWRSRIRFAQEKRRVFFEGSDQWPGADFAIKAYRGETRPDWWSDEDPWVNVNKTKSAIRAALPSLLYSNPKFRVTPKILDDEAQAFGMDPGEFTYLRAEAQELWLNHVWAESNATLHARVAIQNAFVSYGVLKAGYRSDFQDDNQRGVLAVDEATGEYLLDENGDPVLERGKFLRDESGEIIRDMDGFPVLHPGRLCKEMWIVEAIDPRAMLFDVESGPDFFQHRYVIEEWVCPLEDVKRDPRYRRAARERVIETETVNGPASQRKSLFETSGVTRSEGQAARDDEKRVRGFDVYDFESGEYLVVVDEAMGNEGGNDEFLLETAMPDGMEHGPYRFLKFTEDMGTEWYPIPDAIDMALVNREYNITRSQMMIHREHTKTRFLELPGAYNVDGVDAEEERAKWAHGPDGTSVRVSGPGMIQPAPKPQLDGSFMQAIPNIAMDFNEVGGMPGEARGVADADTATQASILATGNEVRNNDRRDNQVNAFLCSVARVLLMSAQANMEQDALVVQKVTQATQGVAPFKARRLTPEELQGEFGVDIELGSTMPKNDPRTLSQLMTLINALAQNPAIGMMKGLVRRVLDGLNLDPLLADEVYEVARQITEAQMKPQGDGNNGGGSPGEPGQAGQVLGAMLGGIGNAAGGSPTGGSLN